MLPHRRSKLLSGKDIINLKNSSLKDIPSGCKEYAPNNSWLEQKQIQVTLETHHSLVGCERIEKKANLSTAIWLSNVGKAKVTKKAGKVWEVFGHTIDSEDWLLPEEALFLLETNALELFRDDVPLSIEETYMLVVDEHCSLEEYRVYSHLSRKGYRVLRHDKDITVTAYEKNINLDQICLAEKRCAPSTVVASKAVNDAVIEEEGGNSKIDGVAGDVSTCVPEVELRHADETGKSPVRIENGPKSVEFSADSSVSDKAKDVESSGVLEVELRHAEEVEKSPIRMENGSESVKVSADSSASDKAKCVESTGVSEVELRRAEEVKKSPIRMENGSESVKVSAESSASDKAKCVESTGVPEVELRHAEEVKKSPIPIETKSVKFSTVSSVSDKAMDVESTGVLEVELTSVEKEQSPVCTEVGKKGVESFTDSSVQENAKDQESTGVPGEELTSAEGMEQSPIRIEYGSKGVNRSANDSSVAEDKSKDIESTLEKMSDDNCDTAPAAVVDISLVVTDEKEESSDVEMHDESNASDSSNLTASGMVPLKKSTPDLYIVEGEQDDIIEIDDDNEGEESDTQEVEIITEIKKASHMDTVDLLDSEEDDDDDVVFICQKSGNTDPSKWRKWFLTIPAFVNTTFPEEIDPSKQKPSKLKLIDLFDLGNKTIDTIMKAIPSHDGSISFINAPDMRFTPPNIVPKYAHYRINVQTYDGAKDGSDTHSVRSSGGHPNVDTSQSLSDVVQYGQEPANFSRNPYGYSFHRTRNNDYRRNPWNPQHYSQNRNSQFQRQNQPFRPNRFIPSDQNKDSESPVINNNEGTNQNDFNRGLDNQNRNCYTSNASQNFGRQNNFRGSWNNNQNNFQKNFANNQNPAQFGGFQQNVNAPGGQLKLALQQAFQMQLLAMNLMQNSQVLMQNCGAPNLLSNPQMNFNPANNFNSMNNFSLGSNFNPMNNFNSINIGNPFTNQFSSDFRGRRPYRRPYMRRGFAGRRRFYNNDRGSPKVTEVPEVVCIDSDEEDSKVKQTPAFKRMLALGAIADLNSPKRTKVIEITEIVDVKPAGPVKSESKPSSKSDVEVTPVKNEWLPTKAVPVGSASVCKTEEATTASAFDTVSLGSDVCEVGSVMNNVVPDKSIRSPLSITDDRTNSPTMEIVDDESASSSDSVTVVDSINASTSEHPMVPEDEGAETDVVMVEGRDEESSTSKVGEVVSASDGSQVTSVEEVLSGSWQSYKQGLDHHTDLPSHSKTFSSLLSYDEQRAGVHDVLKSLQIFGPIDETETNKEQIRVSFDVYLPNQPFRKSVRLLPNYRVIVTGSLCFPSVYELNYLKETYRDGVPFLYAVVYDDSVGLYNLHSVALPTLAENV